MRNVFLAIALAATLIPSAVAAGFEFQSIDGGVIDLDDWRGKPILVVNTASLCAYTGQYDGLQALHDLYAPQGLMVLAVPSDDFAQELADEAAVKEYCDVNFDLTLPMTEITHVKGQAAHPFYAWVRDQTGFVPGWNFNKVLIGPDGTVAETWGSAAPPEGRAMRDRIEAMLP
jgi:glutathione peroxidase